MPVALLFSGSLMRADAAEIRRPNGAKRKTGISVADCIVKEDKGIAAAFCAACNNSGVK